MLPHHQAALHVPALANTGDSDMFPVTVRLTPEPSNQGRAQAAPSGRKPCVSQPLPMPEMRITFSMNCRLRSVYSCANR